MGILHRAIETYDANEALIGEYSTNKSPLAPIFHTITVAQLEITLDSDGNFIMAQEIDKKADDWNIIIPVTEDSEVRTGKNSYEIPHPLSDKLQLLVPSAYLKKKIDGHKRYVELLKEWCESEYSHPKVQAIYKYILGGSIVNDLESFGLNLVNDEGFLNQKVEGNIVRWRVLSDDVDACWLDKSLFQSYINFYKEKLQQDAENIDLCMVTGEYTHIVDNSKHKKIYGRAKYISSNDKENFTYKGENFLDAKDALTISSEASQKAHNVLKWLLNPANGFCQEIVGTERRILCWNPNGKAVPNPLNRLSTIENEEHPSTLQEYSDYLQDMIEKQKQSFEYKDHIVVAIYDGMMAKNNARTGLIYYQESIVNDYYQNLLNWEKYCAWENGIFGIQSPSLILIAKCAFGHEKSDGSLMIDTSALKNEIKPLMQCKLEGKKISSTLVKKLVQNASRTTAYTPNNRLTLLFVTCAIIRKYRKERFKEDWKMELDESKMTRSYQFGRILALLEKAEKDAYSQNETRVPFAIEKQEQFVRVPLKTTEEIARNWKRGGYYKKLALTSRNFYEIMLSELLTDIQEKYPLSEWNKKLDETYLMGYFAQKKHYIQKILKEK